MSETKVMIVDDSPFSRIIITEYLQKGGCKVVGEADSIDSLVETYNNCKPDIVTMDLVMPGADGFECTRVLRLNDHGAKIILISSMKDEETEAEARRLDIKGYIQKPIDGEILIKTINEIMSPDTLFSQLEERGLETFQEALAQNVTRMFKIPVSFVQVENYESQYVPQGITTVIGIIGRHSGSMIMDLSTDTAEKIVEKLLHRPHKNQEEVLTMVAELANIIAGVACSMLNKYDKTLSLRVSPPSIFSSNIVKFTSPNLKMRSFFAEAEFGSIFLGVGFKKGLVKWMSN
ncbi:MAG: response regulator [Desulfitobacteriaceae bacterium]